MTNLDLKKIGVQELDAKEMVDVEGGGFGPFGVGFRVIMKPSFILWQAQQMA